MQKPYSLNPSEHTRPTPEGGQATTTYTPPPFAMTDEQRQRALAIAKKISERDRELLNRLAR